MEDPRKQCCCCRMCAGECRMANLSLKHQPKEDFFKSQWQTSEKSVIWLLYRWLLAIYFTCAVAFSLWILYSNGIWLVYLTNWSFLMCMGMTIYSAVIQSIYHCKPGAFSDDSKVIKFYWAFHFSTVVLSILVTLLYWTLVHIRDNTDINISKKLDTELIDNYSKHGANTIIMLVDQMLVAFPTRLMHAIYPISVGIVYLIFTYIYYLCGGRDRQGNLAIYPILDWELPIVTAITFIVTILFVYLFAWFCFSLYKLRVKLYSKLHRTRST